MELASALSELSFGKDLRDGQKATLDALATHRKKLVVKLPTGYGKTFTGCAVYSVLKRAGLVDRLLVIFATDKQLDQFLQDAPKDDLPKARVDGPLQVVDIRYQGIASIRAHQTNQRQIFAVTIQSLIQAAPSTWIKELLNQRLWMVWIDEHHHYGLEKTWGANVLALNCRFLLATSATPSRPGRDEAFGQPNVTVTYEAACDEEAVKELHGHAYHYKMEIDVGGERKVYSTTDLIEEAGGDDPDKIEKLRVRREMRWAPTFSSPLITVPIDRLLSQRLHTGYQLQALFTGLCVSHAQFVCGQIRDMYPELRVDWVGTGEFGREEETNKEILSRFCPPKDENGIRAEPTLDVLVHVGMAGEGLDSIYVSEIVHLANATLTNRVNQINGRAARYLEGVVGHINFDASSEFAEKKYLGEAVMQAMDALPAKHKDQPPKPDDDDWPPVPPEEPPIILHRVDFVGIDSGDAGVQSYARFLNEHAPRSIDLSALRLDKDHPGWKEVIDLYKMHRQREADDLNDTVKLAQWMNSVSTLLTQVVGLVIKRLRERGAFVDGTVAGRIKHRINDAKMRAHGPLNEQNRDIERARIHYQWLRALDFELRTNGIPPWLSG